MLQNDNSIKKISLALALCCASFYSMADQLPLGGFSYGPVEARPVMEFSSRAAGVPLSPFSQMLCTIGI